MANCYIHKTAVIDQPVHIGDHTKIWHFCHIMPDVSIGKNCVLGQNVFVAEGVVIGNNVHIQNNVSVYAGVTLEDDVFCGPSCVFTNDRYPRAAYPKSYGEFGKIVVRQGASIGANATILPGVILGSWCFVAAGAIVTRDVPANALVKGSPARIAGWVNEDISKIRRIGERR